MKELFESLKLSNGVIITAPPGWGKTYKILKSIAGSTNECSFLFIFPLRALCDEVYISALNKKIDVLNLKSSTDFELHRKKQFKLIVTTSELAENLSEDDFLRLIVILDEFHLTYYWGESFRPGMMELYYKIGALGSKLIMLTATASKSILNKTSRDLSLNYENLYHLDFGNQGLKNYPEKVFYYPWFFKNWIIDDYRNQGRGLKLVFCEFRSQVKEIAADLEYLGFSVLSCVGGEAKAFVEKLNSGPVPDYIIATSVVGHGVNLPNIRDIYFLYKVKNIDFYLQMIGRGGRDGSGFNCHTINPNYFSKKELFWGILRIFKKRLRNKIKSLIYCAYEC